jgi:hypothetical protein
MSMTLTELTDRLAKVSREPASTVNRQARHWTDLGVLPLTGELNTGTGRGRLYEDEALYLAAVAVELARYGVTAGTIKKVLAALAPGFRDRGSRARDVVSGELKLWLLLAPTGIGEHLWTMFWEPKDVANWVLAQKTDAQMSSALIINLHGLWRKLRS